MSKSVVCIGSALVDELFHATETMLMHTTNNVTATKSAGGVSRNIAHNPVSYTHLTLPTSDLV